MRKFLVAALIGLLGAAMHTGSAAAESPRNGARPRLLATQAGDVELRIPKLRKGRSSRSSSSRGAGSTRPCMRW